MTVDSTSKALSLIFKRLLLHGEIPGDWKSANVAAKKKKKNVLKGDKNNYRPVSLTSIVVKLLESIIRDQL